MSNPKPKGRLAKAGEWCNKHKILAGIIATFITGVVVAGIGLAGALAAPFITAWLKSDDDAGKAVQVEQKQDSSSKAESKSESNGNTLNFYASPGVTPKPLVPTTGHALTQKQFVTKWAKLSGTNGQDLTDFHESQLGKLLGDWEGRAVGLVEGMDACLRIDFGVDGIKLPCDCYLADPKELELYRDTNVDDVLKIRSGRLTFFLEDGLQIEDCQFFPLKDKP